MGGGRRSGGADPEYPGDPACGAGGGVLRRDIRAVVFHKAICGEIHQYAAGEDELRRYYRKDDPDRRDGG